MKTNQKVLQIENPIVLIGLVLLIFFSSCAVSSKVASNVTYVKSNFSTRSLEVGGLALLPVVAGSGVEGYRRPFGEVMNLVADSLIQNFMTWNETLDKLNDADLVSEYNRAIVAYQETSIIDKTILRKMQEATGMDYFLFVLLAPPTSDTKISHSIWTGNITTTETKSVSAFALVWSAIDGDVVWEASSTAEVKTGSYTYTSETDMQRAEKVAKAIMSSLYK